MNSPTIESSLRKQVGIDVAQQAGLTADLLSLAKMQRHQLNHTTAQRLGIPPMEDEMGDIILGDRVTNTTIPAPQQAEKTPWAQLALAGGLMATGIGIPAAAMIATNALTNMRQSATQTAPSQNVSREILSIDMVVEPPKKNDGSSSYKNGL